MTTLIRFADLEIGQRFSQCDGYGHYVREDYEDMQGLSNAIITCGPGVGSRLYFQSEEWVLPL